MLMVECVQFLLLRSGDVDAEAARSDDLWTENVATDGAQTAIIMLSSCIHEWECYCFALMKQIMTNYFTLVNWKSLHELFANAVV